MNYLSVENLSKSYGVRVLFENMNFGINKGQKVAFIAKNGTGKSSLLKIIANQDTADGGEVILRNGITIGMLDQVDDLGSAKTVLDAVLLSDNEGLKAVREYELALNNPEDLDAYQKAFDGMDANDAWDIEASVKQILGKLKILDLAQPVEELSGGQRKRICLARVLISEPDFLILDEPTNHLDLEMIEWLEQYLSRANLTLFMVTHDRYFLDRICDEIIELDEAQLFRYKGNYSYFLEKKQERFENTVANISKAKNLYSKELEWMRRQPKARGTKAQARVDSFYEVKKDAHRSVDTSKVKMEIKMERLGGKILEIRSLKKAFGDLNILNKMDYSFQKGERLGIIGNNGTGKSTFIKMLLGLESIDSGKIVHGETVKFGYYSQEGINLKADKRVIEVIKDIAEYIPIGGKGKKLTASQMLETFLFDGDAQYTYVSKLSGGEKRRLHLLTVLMANPNFLILDEPTNDLDILTLNVLEEFLLDFQGCLILITHDRYFMDKLVDHLFIFEGEGRVKDFNGHYSEYKAAKKAPSSLTKEPKNVVEKQEHATQPKIKTKLTFNEKQEFERLEKEIEEIEKRINQINNIYISPNEADDLNSLSKEMGQLSADLEAKESRWLTLSEFA